jgi:putative SOS response-associated peptidase YedK
MCRRFTIKATRAELVAIYRLTTNAAPHNLQPRYNVCPTDPVDAVTAEEGKRELVTMRWGGRSLLRCEISRVSTNPILVLPDMDPED